jgi:hypothetical protein
MRYELSDYEWTAIKPMLLNKPRGVRRVNDRDAAMRWHAADGEASPASTCRRFPVPNSVGTCLAARDYSAIISPEPPSSAGKSFSFGKPSRTGSTVSA